MKYLLTIGSVILLAAASCSRPGCAQKAGNTTRVSRTVGDFAQLVIMDNVAVVLSEGPRCRVEIETDENIQASVSAEVQNGQLFLRNNASCSIIRRPGEQITAYVTLPKLTRIDYQGSGTVSCTDTLHTDYISIEADHAAGDIRLKLSALFTKAQVNNEVADLIFEGKSDSCWAWSASRGTIDFRNFEVKRMHIQYAGVRDAFVNATETLRATIYNDGNVFYKGTPQILTRDLRSSGRLLVY